MKNMHRGGVGCDGTQNLPPCVAPLRSARHRLPAHGRRSAPICPAPHVVDRRYVSVPGTGCEPPLSPRVPGHPTAAARAGARTDRAARYLAALRRSWPIVFRACSVKRTSDRVSLKYLAPARWGLCGVTAGQSRGDSYSPCRAGAKPAAWRTARFRGPDDIWHHI